MSDDGLHAWERYYLYAFAFMAGCASLAFLLFTIAAIWRLIHV